VVRLKTYSCVHLLRSRYVAQEEKGLVILAEFCENGNLNEIYKQGNSQER
jgi:hypothetical protein